MAKKTKKVYVCSDKFGVLRVFEQYRCALAYEKWYNKIWPNGIVFITLMNLYKTFDGAKGL